MVGTKAVLDPSPRHSRSTACSDRTSKADFMVGAFSRYGSAAFEPPRLVRCAGKAWGCVEKVHLLAGKRWREKHPTRIYLTNS